MARMKFMNTEIDNLTMEETLQAIDQMIQENKSAYVVTPNVDHIVQLETNTELQDVYKNASLILTDGKPLLWIAKWYGTPIKEKISGSDLFPRLCDMAAKKGYKMFFLGAAEGVAAKAAENLSKRFKGLQVVGTYSPPFGFEKNQKEMENHRWMEVVRRLHKKIACIRHNLCSITPANPNIAGFRHSNCGFVRILIP